MGARCSHKSTENQTKSFAFVDGRFNFIRTSSRQQLALRTSSWFLQVNVLFTSSFAACSGSAGIFAISAFPSAHRLRLDWQSTAFRTNSEPYVLLTLQVTLSTVYTYNFGSSRLANSRRIGCKRYFETHLPSCGEG